MTNCKIDNIRAIFSYPEAYFVELDGTKNREDVSLLTERPSAYHSEFREFYCVEHDCTFKQWKPVLRHLEVPMHE